MILPWLCIDIDDENSHKNLPYASIIVGGITAIEKHQHQFPLDTKVIETTNSSAAQSQMPSLYRKVAAISSSNQGVSIQDNWANQLSWRLCRQYEQRFSIGNEDKKFASEIAALLPVEGLGIDAQKIQTDIQRIRRVALPSILETMQHGFERKANQRVGNAFSDGLPENVLEQRHTLLEYQHRMHPAISAFSREHIYHGEALIDPDDMAHKRHWGYLQYTKQAMWLDCSNLKSKNNINSNNDNQVEAERIIEELLKFLRWAKTDQRKDGKNWTVAILTFYRGQEKLLRQQLRRELKQKNAYQTFRKDNVTIQLCTVDRFQGHEADLVFLSFVKNHPTTFLASPNRLNVAVTRARYQFVAVGNRKKFEDKGKGHQSKRFPELVKLAGAFKVTRSWSSKNEKD